MTNGSMMSQLYQIANNRPSRRIDPRAHLMLKLTYLPAFITTVFRSMPGVWKAQHRLLLCWLIVMQAVYPGRKTLQDLANWSPPSITEWRLRRLLKAGYWCVHLLIEGSLQLGQGALQVPRPNLARARGRLLQRVAIEQLRVQGFQQAIDPARHHVIETRGAESEENVVHSPWAIPQCATPGGT